MEEPVPYEKENNLAGIGDIKFGIDYNFLAPITKREGILLADNCGSKFCKCKLYYIPSANSVVRYLNDKEYVELIGSFDHPEFDKYRDKVK